MKNFEIRDLKLLFAKRNAQVNIFFKVCFICMWKMASEELRFPTRVELWDLLCPWTHHLLLGVEFVYNPHAVHVSASVSPAHSGTSVVLHIHRVCVRCFGFPWVGGLVACAHVSVVQENVTPASPGTTDVKNVHGELKAQWQKIHIFLLYKLKHLVLSVAGAGAWEEKWVRGPHLFGGAVPALQSPRPAPLSCLLPAQVSMEEGVTLLVP